MIRSAGTSAGAEDRARHPRYTRDMSAAPAKGSSTPEAAPADERRPSGSREDVVILGPPTADGAGVHVLRAREARLEAGELRALQQGRPIVGEVVTLVPRKDNPRICDVSDSYKPPTTAMSVHKGPANVATDAYRDGWDDIFGKKSSVPPAAN